MNENLTGNVMKTNEVLEIIGEKDFLDKIYGFAYRRCSSSHDAEELCSEIVLNVIKSVRKQSFVENFYAFVWTVAKRVYADFCKKRSERICTVSIENSELSLADPKNEICEIDEEAETECQLKMIYREIAFLSKAYRDVMVMFYLDEMKISDIAQRLSVSENTIKQRLFSARNIVKKEVSSMENKHLALQPIMFHYVGTGNPCGNQPSEVATRTFSKSLIYLLKDKAKTAKELSEELCVPMMFIEEELAIQCAGLNGEYGMVRKLENGKYIANVIVADYEEANEAQNIFGRHLPKIAEVIKRLAEENRDKILNFPFLSKQEDIRFVLWHLVNGKSWTIQQKVDKLLETKYFSGIVPAGKSRPYSQVAIAARVDSDAVFKFYGCDGISANEFCGYANVQASNMYGPRLAPHFHCGHNMANDVMLSLTVRSVGGIKIESLREDEKEITAKAIECGYIRKNGDIIEPNVLIYDNAHQGEFNELLTFGNELDDIIEDIASELAEYIRTHLPKHLENEYLSYSALIASARLGSDIIEECIKANVITEPQNALCGEGVIIRLTK